MKTRYVEVQGFRAYGGGPQRIDLTSQLVVLHADNSHGKTSLVEGLEFLFSGSTTRRSLLGGSVSEFTDALRNAHLQPTVEVYVEIGLEADDGTHHVLRRELTCDYRGANDCVSTLTLDGAKIADVSAIGLRLSNPPLSAPVLLEHTLRYAVSAKPGERSDYFKAVLEVSDLDVVRQHVRDLLAERVQAEPSSTIRALERLADITAFETAVRPLRTSHDVATVTNVLSSLCDAVAPPTPGAPARSLADASAAVTAALDRRQAQTLPLAELIAPAPAEPVFAPKPRPGKTDESRDTTPALWLAREFQVYGERIDKVDQATATMLPILEAAMNVGAIRGIREGHPIDCPLCLAPETLGERRVSAIRAQLADLHGLTAEAQRLQKLVQTVRDRAETLAFAAARSVPPAAQWSPELRQQRSDVADSLAVGDHALQDILGDIEALALAASSAEASKAALFPKLDVLAALTRDVRPVRDDDVTAAGEALTTLLDDAVRGARLHRSATDAATSFSEAVRPQLAAATATNGWATIARLSADPDKVQLALAAETRRAAATKLLKVAHAQIDAAAQEVLDRRLLSMDGEIRRWWDLLRPSELTTFDAITRRGAGQRFLDVKAALATSTPVPGVVRNALAVLSTSQLNALGLSAFLARCQLLQSPLVVLDDPIPGSDREHRSTFANGVIGALLDDGRHVLVCTHDPDLARSLHVWHQHRGVGQYQAVLVDPTAGTVLRVSGDEFEQLMLEAQNQMHSPLKGNRRVAGNNLRIATERLAKHVAVAGRRRGGDTAACIDDYKGKNLKDLGSAARRHAVKENEPGEWAMLARVLNDANHDAEPPQPSELKQCHSTLKQIKRQHLKEDPNLMKP